MNGEMMWDSDARNPAHDLDLCYLHHIGRKYWSLMREQEVDKGPVADDSTCIFAHYYQFLREAIFAHQHGGVFVLLCDERSPVFYCDGPQGPRGLMPFLTGLLPEKLRQRICQVTVQELAVEIQASPGHDWIQDFKFKYGLAAPRA